MLIAFNAGPLHVSCGDNKVRWSSLNSGGELHELEGARQARIFGGAGGSRDAFEPSAWRGDAEDFLGQFALLGCGSVSAIGFEPWDETRVKEAGLGAIGFARTADFFEKKSRVIHARDRIVSELHTSNGIDVASDGERIAPISNVSRKRIVDAENLLANAPFVVSAHAADDATKREFLRGQKS